MIGHCVVVCYLLLCAILLCVLPRFCLIVTVMSSLQATSTPLRTILHRARDPAQLIRMTNLLVQYGADVFMKKASVCSFLLL